MKDIIEKAWDIRSELSPTSHPDIKEAVLAVLDDLDSGKVRVSEKKEGQWIINEWLKKAVLLSFRLQDNTLIKSTNPYFDKVPLKTQNWNDADFTQAGFRFVPGGYVRHSAYVAKNAVLMPSYINVGAYVDEGTMIDTWATVGSCAQVGKNCHISGGVGLGGVLEPLQANPVIIEDNCFIGARSEVAEGVIIGEGSVLSMGVFISQSTKIVNRDTGDIHYGYVPPYSVVVPGTLPNSDPLKPSLACAVIVKIVDEKTRSKTSINDLLRD